MNQTKFGSLLEALMNVSVGFLTTLIFSPFIYYISGVSLSYSKMGLITFYFTVLSVLRSYVIRRWFNKKKI